MNDFCIEKISEISVEYVTNLKKTDYTLKRLKKLSFRNFCLIITIYSKKLQINLYFNNFSKFSIS